MTPAPATRRIRASTLTFGSAGLLAIRLRDPADGREYWSLPGGAIEQGETPAIAARRETLEETGYDVVVDPHSGWVSRYSFAWNDAVYDCETHWFLAGLNHQASRATVTDASYILRSAWIPEDALDTAFAYHEDILAVVRHAVRLAQR